jgi:hypothetical protein
MRLALLAFSVLSIGVFFAVTSCYSKPAGAHPEYTRCTTYCANGMCWTRCY